MTVIKAYTELPDVRAHSLENGGVSIEVDGNDVDLSMVFCNRADAFRFSNAITRALSNMTEAENANVCEVCGFNVELTGHSAECPKRVPA